MKKEKITYEVYEDYGSTTYPVLSGLTLEQAKELVKWLDANALWATFDLKKET